jgi:hypothetical protein
VARTVSFGEKKAAAPTLQQKYAAYLRRESFKNKVYAMPSMKIKISHGYCTCSAMHGKKAIVEICTALAAPST